jgi:NTE family protein
MDATAAVGADGPLRIGLALQGGGSHGAFGWGVLHELLEADHAVEIAAVSGTSAGAVNAVVYADGWLRRPEEPRRGAQEALARFWGLNARAAAGATAGMLRPSPLDAARGDPTLKNNPFFVAFDLAGRLFSQYELRADVNPLRHTLERAYGLDPTRLRDPAAPLVFLTATDVATGEAVVFDNGELTLNAVLASACLPTLVRAVKVKGRPMWDGGYSGNPALWPLVRHTEVDDVLIVQVNPVDVDEPPETARDIINRINEITFNASLLSETRALERLNDMHLVVDELARGLRDLDRPARDAILARLARRMREVDAARSRTQRLRGMAHRWRLPRSLVDLLATGPGEGDDHRWLDTRQFEEHPLRPVALHIIHGDDALDRYDASSKFNATEAFLRELFELGRAKAREWLARRLPLILANREAGVAVSTFAPEAGLSGR